MRECTSISNSWARLRHGVSIFAGVGVSVVSLVIFIVIVILPSARSAQAATLSDADTDGDYHSVRARPLSLHALAPVWKPELTSRLIAANGAANGTGNGKDRSLPSDEEDFTTTPFTEYGEFNEDEDEEAETKFLQFGRLFGVSLSVGQDTPLGNRGEFWQGGFPLVAGELHYWFDFHLALDLGFSWVEHYFETTYGGQGHVDISLIHVYVNLRYYFDTKNLSAPISFANPYILLGFGEFGKTQTDQALGTTDNDSEVGVTGGVGLEFPIMLQKTYFDLQATLSSVTFKDTYLPEDPTVVSDLTGPFLTVTAGILFTW